MLQGLYNVDWKNLTHAYGNAADVPGMILALASPRKADREYGLELIRENLFVRGAIFEASVYAVDYLTQLLEHPLFEEKPAVLVLLAQMVNGRAPLDVLEAAGLIVVDEGDAEFRARLAEERTWAQLTREAVEANVDVYLRSLDHSDAAERVAAAYLLAHLTTGQERVGRGLLKRLAVEFEPEVKASLLYALGELAGEQEGLRVAIERFAGAGVHPLVRLAAMMALVRLDEVQADEQHLTGLVDVLSSLDAALPQVYAAQPWAEGHLFADIALCLCHYGSAQAARILPDLIRVLDRVPSRSAVSIAYAMLLLAFGQQTVPAGLTDLQNAVLDAISDSVQLAAEPRATRRLMGIFGV